MLLQVDLMLDQPDLIRQFLESLDCRIELHSTKGSFWGKVQDSTDVIIVDLEYLPQPYEDSIQTLLAMPNEPDVIVVVSEENAELRAQLIAAGCIAIINSNVDPASISEMLESLLERISEEVTEQIESEFNEKKASLNDFNSQSPRMNSFIKTVRRVVDADSSLLILGETGVGKERLARAIHEESPRNVGPFVPVNCAAFPESLLEGELFGHDEGAFTGATGDRRGYFEMAHGGTLFLDEIGEVPRHVQVKLLRVLQERCIQRLGSETEIEIDVRIVAATNRDLNGEIESKRFRRDLYYRLSVVTLEVPPLRDHPEDIPVLLQRYLDEFRLTVRNRVSGFSDPASECLFQYAWPGNVRELINVVERAVLLCEGTEITLTDLPPGIANVIGTVTGYSHQLDDRNSIKLPDEWESAPWLQVRDAVLGGIRLEYLRSILRRTGGRVREAAELAGLSQRSLYVMLKKHELDHKSFRDPKR